MENIYYIEDFISFIRIITTELNFNVDKNSSVFYRGHSNVKYQLCPSIFRNNEGLNLKYEDAYYNEILSAYCDEFAILIILLTNCLSYNIIIALQDF